jgi:HSP20 family protein
MNLQKDKAPTKLHEGSEVTKTLGEDRGAWPSLVSIRDEMDRLYENIARGFSFLPVHRRAFETPLGQFETAFGTSLPAVDVVEHEKEFTVTAELPGLTLNDIDLSVSDNTLTIKGEKKEEKEEKAKNYYMSERKYGSFQRSLPLPHGVNRDKVAARFENGVLSVTLPKTPEAIKSEKKVAIQGK